jgi:hypothetical protein
MRNLIRTAAVATALLACTAGAFADEPFALYDANGVRMGRFSDGVVQLTVDGQQYMVPVGWDRHSTSTLDYETTPFYFEATRCKGQKLVIFARSYGGPLAVTRVELSGRVLLFPLAKRWSEVNYPQSYLRDDGKCAGPGGAAAAAEVLDPIDITDLFARPFTVR